jgi:hypothetical protein
MMENRSLKGKTSDVDLRSASASGDNTFVAINAK